MLGSYKWSVLKVSSTAAGILICFGSLWFVDPSTQLVGRQLAIFYSLEMVHFGGAYDVLMVNCANCGTTKTHKATPSMTGNGM